MLHSQMPIVVAVDMESEVRDAGRDGDLRAAGTEGE